LRYKPWSSSDVRIVFRKTSLVDYPPLVSAVLFFPGCNLRCPWCHNRELVLGSLSGPAGAPAAELNFTGLDAALVHIEKRKKVLGGVVISGGEPTLYPGLGEYIISIKNLGLKLKLDTNGMRPDILEALFAVPRTRPDYIAMDLKLAPERYGELLPPAAGAGPAGNPRRAGADCPAGEALRRSAALLRSSGIAHEFRSLDLPGGYFTESDRAALAELAGDSPWKIRPFIPGNCIDPAWNEA